MKCLNCNGEKFAEKRIRIPSEFRGETIEALVPAFVCQKCEEPLMNDAQMSLLRQEIADTYRRQNHLLTAKEIIDFRKHLNFSQRQFAAYLGVGEASIKRWETHFIQDKSQDAHIKLMCDKAMAEQHVFDLGNKLGEKELRGNRDFSWDHFKNAVLYLLQNRMSPLFLNKALFYADFLNFKNHGTSITGCIYAKLDHGPCPDEYRILFRRMMTEGILREGHELDLIAQSKPDLAIFDDNEKASLNMILKKTETKKGQKALFDQSHEENAFKKTKYYAQISYKFALNLTI